MKNFTRILIFINSLRLCELASSKIPRKVAKTQRILYEKLSITYSVRWLHRRTGVKQVLLAFSSGKTRLLLLRWKIHRRDSLKKPIVLAAVELSLFSYLYNNHFSINHQIDWFIFFTQHKICGFFHSDCRVREFKFLF